MSEVDENALAYARAVSQRIAQRALTEFSQFLQEGTAPGGDTYSVRGAVAVNAMAAVVGALIGALSSSAENLAAGVQSAGETMLSQACGEMSRRTGNPIVMQRPAEIGADPLKVRDLGPQLRELVSAAQQAAGALKTAERIMDAVPRMLHLNPDQQIARVGVLTHELGGFSQVANAQDALLAALAFAEQGPTTNPPAGG